MKKSPISIFWFRRDLRLEDNAGLWMALKSGLPVLPIFIFDKNILDKLENKKDARVLFIHQELENLKNKLEKLGATLQVFYGTPKEVYAKILAEYEVKTVFFNRDYEPYAQARDKEIYEMLKQKSVEFKGSKDQVIFEKNEITKDDKKPYTIFTPYAKKWKRSLSEFYLRPYPTEKYFDNFIKCSPFYFPKISEIGFEDFEFKNFPARKIDF